MPTMDISNTDTPTVTDNNERRHSIRPCHETDYPSIVALWERSVRATHEFLTEDDILEIKSKLASEYFPAVDIHILDVDGKPHGRKQD